MRLQQLSLRVPGDEFRVRFHDRLTVLNGIGVLERRALTDSLLGALAGGPGSTELTYLDGTGRTVRISCEGGRLEATYEDDGSPATPPIPAVAADAAELRRLLVVGAADLGLGRSRAGEPPELAEARATLEALTEELNKALTARQAVEGMRAELAAIDERIRQSEEDQARRHYARLLADLERLRAEAAALRSGRTGADGDRHLLGAADRTRSLAERWREAGAVVVELAAAFGDQPRLDERTLAELAGLPHDVPAELPGLATELARTQASHDELNDRLRELAASKLSEPSDPLVAELARLDQDLLWATHRRVVEAAARLEDESLRLGGVTPADEAHDAPDVTEAIEAAHARAVEADILAERGRRRGVVTAAVGVIAGSAALPFLPVAAPAGFLAAGAGLVWFRLRPARMVKKAEKRERQALERAGAATYLAFHLRRVDAILDPDARERLELAHMEHRLALGHWRDLVGDLTPEAAAALEPEVRDYAAALTGLGSAAAEIDEVRREVDERAAELAELRDRVLTLAGPFGADDAATALRFVEHQVAQARIAAAQVRLQEAEAREAELEAELDETLATLGFAEGELAARVGAFEWALARAAERERARSGARDLAEVEAELTKLEAEARSQRRPEWGTVQPSEADAPDIEELQQRRDATATAYQAAAALLPDVERLADRHSALERRVAVLEAGVDGGGETLELGEVREYLLARLTKASAAGPADEPLPVVLDEPFLRAPADAKWELLDLLERLTEKVQVVYLTDDPYIGAWARRRSADGAITLLEPVTEGA